MVIFECARLHYHERGMAAKARIDFDDFAGADDDQQFAADFDAQTMTDSGKLFGSLTEPHYFDAKDIDS